ncbi:DNA translocase FtsK [Thiothrix sp.]|nr:DNA translocase FtsK [Thiothrix sp.]
MSFLQRRLKIGYNRAERMLERMESEGIVSALNSEGVREICA